MNWDLANRTASVAITALLAILIADYDQWVSLVIGFGFAHYLLSFYYARARISAFVGHPSTLLPLVSLGAMLAVIYFLEFPLEIYFGIHHACNEGYLRRNNAQDTGSEAGRLQAPRALFHLAAYFCILRNDPMVSQLPDFFLWALLVIATLLYFMALRTAHTEAASEFSGVFKASGVEIMVLLMVGLSCFTDITFLHVVMYHFVLWTIVPIPLIRDQGIRQLTEYGLLTLGSLLFFIVMITSQLFSSYLSLSFFYSQFIVWSYIHITTSFALSSAHPHWIVSLFRSPLQSGH